MTAPEPTLTAVDALGVVEQWLDDDEEMRIPGNEWGTRLYEALKDVVRSAREPGAEPALVAEVRRLRAKLAAVEAEKEAILGQVDQAARMLRLTGAIAASQTVIAQVRRWPQFVDAAALATTGEGQ